MMSKNGRTAALAALALSAALLARNAGAGEEQLVSAPPEKLQTRVMLAQAPHIGDWNGPRMTAPRIAPERPPEGGWKPLLLVVSVAGMLTIVVVRRRTGD